MITNITLQKDNNQNINQISTDYESYEKALELEYLEATNKYYLCPFCKSNIPLIIPFINRKLSQINLYLICECGKKTIISIKELFYVDIFKKKQEESPAPLREKICDLCKTNDNRENILYCLSCNLWLCKECRTISFKKEEENHCYLEKKLEIQSICEEHELYKNNYFCRDCELPVCVYCIKKKHSKHKTISIINYYDEINNKFSFFRGNKRKNSLDLFNDEEKLIDKDIIFNNLREKIYNVKKYEIYYNNLCNEDKLEKDESIHEYIIKNFKINIQIFFLLKFTYERFELSKGFLNINLITSMNYLFDENNKEFICNNYDKSSLFEFNYSLKKFLYDNFIINFKNLLRLESLGESSSFDNDKITQIIRINDYSYIYLSEDELMYNEMKSNSKSKYMPKETAELEGMLSVSHTIIENKNYKKLPLLIPKQRSMSIIFPEKKRSRSNEEIDKILSKNQQHKNISNLLLVGKDILLFIIGSVIEKYKIINLLLEPITTLTGHKADIVLSYVNSANILISASKDNTIKIWDLNNNKCLFNIYQTIYSIVEAKNLTNIVYCGSKKGIISLDLAKQSCSKPFNYHKDKISSLLINKDEKLISGSIDKSIKLLKINPFEIEKELYMKGEIYSFTKINDVICGVTVQGFGLYIIDYIELLEIKYINIYNEKILFLSSLGEDYFWAETDDNKYRIIKGQNLSKKNDIIIFN